MLSELDGSILFNTEFIYVPTAEAAYVDRTNTAEFMSKSSGDSSGSRLASAQPVRVNARPPGATGDQADYQGGLATSNPMSVTVTPSNSNKRMMIITVPATAGPGSVLTVSAPDGTLLSVRHPFPCKHAVLLTLCHAQVVVPHTAEPGASITVQY